MVLGLGSGQDLLQCLSPHGVPGPPDSLLLSAGGGADLLKGPQPPRGPQPDAHSPGRLLPLRPQRVGAILPGVYHHSLPSRTLTPSLPPSTLLPLGSTHTVRFKTSHSTKV